MSRAVITAVLAALAALAAPAQGAAGQERLVLPSGLEAYLLERREDQPDAGNIVRFRFVAEAFTGQEAFEAQTADLEFLCNEFALTVLDLARAVPDRVVISLADQPSVFGEFDPEVTQIFETFSVQDAACILEVF